MWTAKAMRNLIIMGSGRSGTSMVAGCLAQSGYFMGDSLHVANESNPKGYFEDAAINHVNERLLAPLVPRVPDSLRWLRRDLPRKRQRWLARLPLELTFAPQQEQIDMIHALTAHTPYCFKDPRFSYTLPVWRPYLAADTGFICVFRDPTSTARSILKEIASKPYLATIKLTFRQALDIWTRMYDHILTKHRHEGEWLFVHYDQVTSGTALDALRDFTGAHVDLSFPESGLRHQTPGRERIPKQTAALYADLCARAAYDFTGALAR